MNAPAANTNTFPTTESYIRLIIPSNAKCRDFANFSAGSKPERHRLYKHVKGLCNSLHIPLVSGGKALSLQGLPVTPRSYAT
jgi:hypothetical protein